MNGLDLLLEFGDLAVDPFQVALPHGMVGMVLQQTFGNRVARLKVHQRLARLADQFEQNTESF